MNAVLLERQAPGGKRNRLEDCLPLSTPYVVQFFPIYACNFICEYCHFSIEKSKRCFVSDRVAMDMELYRKCVDDLATFPGKVKTLRFVGMGEPLLHKDIGSMVDYAVRSGTSEKVEILTNASLLTHALSDRLIEAGLDRLVISLQGTNADKYRTIAQAELDFDDFVEQIAYFYANKQHTHIHIKIVDISLDGEEDRQRFFNIFGDICDSIGVEVAVPIFPGVEYNRELQKQNKTTQFGNEATAVDICPQPFFTQQINPDGKVVGCYSVTYPEILGDANIHSLTDIWNGATYNDFRRRMLRGRDTVCDVCRECAINFYRIHNEDRIMNADGRLNALYSSGDMS